LGKGVLAHSLPHSRDLKSRSKKGDCAPGETERGGDSRLDRTRLNNFLIIDAYDLQPLCRTAGICV
jgi:hypothetical protein